MLPLIFILILAGIFKFILGIISTHKRLLEEDAMKAKYKEKVIYSDELKKTPDYDKYSAETYLMEYNNEHSVAPSKRLTDALGEKDANDISIEIDKLINN